jgi:hypothetical protein
LDQVREVLRFHHYALRTEEAYVQWIKRFLVFHRGRAGLPTAGTNASSTPRAKGRGLAASAELGAREVTAFLGSLATEREVAASTQNQALNALVFL